MTARALLADLRRRGVRVRAEGDELVLAPRGLLQPRDLDALRAAKAEIIAALRSDPAAQEPEPPSPPSLNVLAWLVESEAHGYLWLCWDDASAQELRRYERAWEELGDEPLRVVTVADVERLRGKNEPTIGAVLRVFAAFPTAGVLG